ncbi:hypothetical protein FB570_11185 [Streptomyces sp. T12]|uniref:alpha/beta hydrolase n=1 Tax=Streptomyces sp. T12 TaxID=477697 RepID=UPI00119E6ADD|nr:alpha/beta fold hydrolase [Streptomyces sp. T12]TWD17472.1 hypothetical protein FB570_11185 [Streptomyces sp. T12]
MTFTRSDVEIPAEGATLGGWLFIPDGAEEPLPAITMTIGLGGIKDQGLEPFARAFTEAGYVVLAHDHRTFGASSGTPRHDVNPWQQIADWRRAISYLESRPEVDERRIGLWGTSFAGGHALVLGATDRRLRAVVAQVPMISGLQIGHRRALPEHQAAVERRYDEDERAQLRGSAPATVTIVSKDPDVPALYRDPDVVDFYLRPYDSDVQWENKLTLRSSRNSRMYEPGVYIDKVSPTPLLMIVGTHDTMTPTDIALAAYERALEPKRLELIPGGHFAPYLEEFDSARAAAVEWFGKYVS